MEKEKLDQANELARKINQREQKIEVLKDELKELRTNRGFNDKAQIYFQGKRCNQLLCDGDDVNEVATVLESALAYNRTELEVLQGQFKEL